MDDRKPTLVPRKQGHYGRPDVRFWLESEFEEFKTAWDALPERPPPGLVIVKAAAAGKSLATLGKMERVKVLCKTSREERRKGKRRRVGYAIERRLIPAEDLADYLREHTKEQRPTDTLTIREVARLFGISEGHALHLFPPGVRRKGKLLREYRTRSGVSKAWTREGAFFIPAEKVRRLWEKRRPGEPWPLTDRGTAARSEHVAAACRSMPSAESRCAGSLMPEPVWNVRVVNDATRPVPTYNPPTCADTVQETAPRIVIGRFGEPILVIGRPKGPLTFPQYKVVKALVDAGEEGLGKDGLEAVNGDARRILRRLKDADPDWAAVIHFPGRPHGRYRLG